MSTTQDRREAERQSAHEPEADTEAEIRCLTGPGEACELARAVDWASTAIGPVAGWSQSLRSTASLVLHNHSPMLLWWGPQFVQIYNDAYRPVLGEKHPRAMGQRFRDCWSEVFHILGPMAERPFRGGPASVSDDVAVLLERKVPREESHFRLAYSPVPDDTVESGIGGVLATVTEITEQIYADRQLRTLRDLGARGSADAQTVDHACISAAAVLKDNPWDVPFALIYLFDDGAAHARRIASAGLDPALLERLAPATLDLAGAPAETPWRLHDIARARRIEFMAELPHAPESLPRSPWDETVRSALVLPLASPEQPDAYGALICGVSPHRVLDAGYQAFFELASSQVVTSLRDARALEAEHRRAEALAEIDRAKTAFFSNVSHEFRTPLTLMLGPVAELAVDPEFPPHARAKLNLAHRNALRLLRLVNTLLDFSRIEAGRVQASYEPTDLAALTRELASMFRSAIEGGGLTYEVDCETLREPVYIDREMWERIVLNLLSNAFKYTLQGTIAVRLSVQDARPVFEVSDTGAGIPEVEQPRIFHRFHRVEGIAGRSQEGTGIGLALVQELVRLHAGEITVRSQPGHGTTFRVSLPFGTAHLPADRLKAPGHATPAAIGAEAFVQEAMRWLPDDAGSQPPQVLSTEIVPDVPPVGLSIAAPVSLRPRVLVADDNADMRAYIRNLLAAKFEVEIVGDGRAALEAATRERPDLIVSDIMMPGLDGLGVLRALRGDKRLRDVPVILLSARAGEEARVEGLGTGADDYLVKPFSARELVSRIDALIELTALRRKSGERFRALIGASSDAVYSMNADWTEMRFLQGRNFIADTNDASSSWLERYIPEEDRARVSDYVQHAIDHQTRFECEHRIRRLDGSQGWAMSRAIPVKDEHGTVVEWFGMAVDMTERKRIETVLRDNTAWLAALKDAFQAAVNNEPLTVSLDILTHAAAGQMQGQARCAFHIADAKQAGLRHVAGMLEHGTHALETVPIDAGSVDWGRAACMRQAVITPDVNTEPRWKDWLWLARQYDYRACWSFPVETVAGKVVGTFTIFRAQPGQPGARDRELAMRFTQAAAIIVSRQQEAEERAHGVEALRHADRQKDEFLAMLAHELRNPLAPIANAGELLSRMVTGHDGAKAAADMIKRQTTQLTRLVDDLLDISRITQGRITLQHGPVDLAGVVTQAIEMVEPKLREKRHTLTVETTTRDTPLFVEGDIARLVQCVGNLLTNAVKYTDPGGAIHVWTRPRGTHAVIGIADNGSGISAELMPHVFDLFVQSNRTLDRAQGGLGIGLAVVKRLVHMHHGEILVRSDGVGHGATFEIELPRIAMPAGAPIEPDTAGIRSRRVLVVDDNRDAADSLSMLLGVLGHTPEVAYGALEAIERAQTFLPEVALLDIGLPGMNGYELAGKLREIPHLEGVRLVAVTGYGQPEDYQRTREAGFDEHLVKPIDHDALQRSLG
ncbi:ATP-binding protein [Paraburkholderia acidisoli]|uniref:histidine kinase n=1 Tax=Paraburkholderia acidisoli TaxID=2571748 RepID=A0A7Z2JHU0_9BURK|nr:ATP-binding protein [Paraburkholderia acidisoli]QGZ66157.1 response regulator [Paraburkholderia acidisoli]